MTIGFALLALNGRLAKAENVAAVEIASAQSANDELLRTLESRLATQQLTLQKLTELKAHGNATWLEIAHAEAAVAALQANHHAAREFDSFLAALHQRIAQSPHQPNNASSDASDWLAIMPELELQIAAHRAGALGELDAARLNLRRYQLHAATIEQLFGASAASKDELAAAQNAVRDAQLLLTRFSAQHDIDVASYQQLLKAPAECTNSNRAEPFADRELSPDEIPPALLHRDDFLGTLINMRIQRRIASAQHQTIVSRLKFAGGLVHRLEAAQLQTEPNKELIRSRLDVEILKAQQLGNEQRLEFLRLSESYLVATAISQPHQDVSSVIRIDSPTSSLPVSPGGTKTYLSGGQTSPLTAAAWQPIAPNWPINNWSAKRQIIAPSLPRSGNGSVRYSEPNYADFYAYGNLRLDAPSISNNFFRSGGLPWYLPGSTTNFK